MWQMLMAMKACGLKNYAPDGHFYDMVMEHYHVAASEYAIIVFHDCYDIPASFRQGAALGIGRHLNI